METKFIRPNFGANKIYNLAQVVKVEKEGVEYIFTMSNGDVLRVNSGNVPKDIKAAMED